MKHARTRHLTALALTLALSFGLAACGDDEPTDDLTPAPTQTPVPDPTEPTDGSSPEDQPSDGTEPRDEGEPSDDDATGGGVEGGTAPETTEGAIARFEEYLHAFGNADTTTMCEIAAPAMAAMGDCEQTFDVMLQMPSPEQLEALKTATVDPAGVDASTPGTVIIPSSAVVSSATFGPEELGDYTLAFQDGNWFIVD